MGKRFSLQSIFAPVLAVLLVALVALGFQTTGASQKSEAKRTLEESLKRAAVSCYAIEGSYPESLTYLTENYGVYVDAERFEVMYEVFASNVMPDITVLERQVIS